MVNREVCCTNTEPKGISDVVDILDNAICVNIAVSATNDTIGSLDLLLHGASVVVAKAVLTGIILGMVLAALHSSRCNLNRGRGISHWGCRLDSWGWCGVCDRNNGPAWCCLHNRSGGGVVGVVL